MFMIAIFAIEGVFVLAGVLIFAAWLRRRLDSHWRTWVWGAASFVLSQLLRMPLLIALTAVLPAIGFKPDQQTAFWFNLAVLCITSGLFEETSRYIVLRYLAKDARGWGAAVMFGAGHGGIEAILVIVPAMVNNIVLLAGGDTLVAQTRVVSPQQADQLVALIANLRNVSWWLALVALWERVMAITFHIAATILVMQAVMNISRRPLLWWGSAVLYHAMSNAVALLGGHYGGTLGAELGVALFFFVALYIIFRFRTFPFRSASELQSTPHAV
jgi:uncharacterized membrane protein YhfC